MPGSLMLQGRPPGMSERLWQALGRIAHGERGLFIACGPAGSGRTTTLHGLVRAALDARQVPEVLLIGEIRDPDGARAALDAARTHLVLASMHAERAVDVAQRICSLGGASERFVEAFVGAVAQRLVPIACPRCAVIGSPTAEEFEELAGAEVVMRTSHAGCPECVGGAIGREAIYEACLIEDRGDLEQGVHEIAACLEKILRTKGTTLKESALELTKQKRIALTEYAKF